MHSVASRVGAFALLLAIPIAGCSTQTGIGGNGLTPASPIGATTKSKKPPTPLLYVVNGYNSSSNGSSVTVYDASNGKYVRAISNGIANPRAIAFDTAGDAYVANQAGSSSSSGASISVYEPGSTSRLRSITRGVTAPVAIAVSSSGVVFVANNASSSSSSQSGGTIAVYRAGSTRLIHTITDGVSNPIAIGVDAAGTLFVLNAASGSGSSSSSSSSSSAGGSVTVYTAPKYHLTATITAGVTAPSALLVDSKGDVTVANGGPNSSSSSSGSGSSSSGSGSGSGSQGGSGTSSSIVEFTAGSTAPATTVTTGIASPRALTIDGSGLLYVLNAGGSTSSSSSSSGSTGSVTVYEPGSTQPKTTIVDGITSPDAFAVESNGTLFVANSAASSSSSSSQSGATGANVTQYAPHATAVRRTITRNIAGPVALGIP
jgi:sugar lactone lactonase YvrE